MNIGTYSHELLWRLNMLIHVEYSEQSSSHCEGWNKCYCNFCLQINWLWAESIHWNHSIWWRQQWGDLIGWIPNISTEAPRANHHGYRSEKKDSCKLNLFWSYVEWQGFHKWKPTNLLLCYSIRNGRVQFKSILMPDPQITDLEVLRPSYRSEFQKKPWHFMVSAWWDRITEIIASECYFMTKRTFDKIARGPQSLITEARK